MNTFSEADKNSKQLRTVKNPIFWMIILVVLACVAVTVYLLTNQKPTYRYPVYDAMRFDVDGDGKKEYCELGYGQTSGAFTFTFSATERGADEPKYKNIFYTQWYDLSFVKCEDGIVRVKGIDNERNPQTHFFDIDVVDGNIYLAEDGRDIRTYIPEVEFGD